MKKRSIVSLLVSLLSLVGSSRAVSEEAIHSSRGLSLTDCLNIALEHNAQLRTAGEQFLAAKGEALKLHAILYPTVNAQGLTAPTTFYVQINQVLYNRAVFPRLRISRLAQDQAVINYRQTLDNVVFQVRQAFASALGTAKANDLVRDYLSSQTGVLASAQQLFEAGKIQKSAVLSVQVTGNRNTQLQQDFQLSATEARLVLGNLLGQSLPEDSLLTGDLAVAAPDTLNQKTLIEEALRNRADLQLLESLRLTETQRILVDLQNAFPTLGASSNSAFAPPGIGAVSNFDLERNYDEPEVERQQGNSQLPVSLYFTWTVFDGGTLAGTRARDQADLETQDVAVAALKHSIPGEVVAALSALQAAQDALRHFDSSTSPADLRKSAELDYQAGRIRQLDLVNFERDLLEQAQLRLAAQLRLTLALAALDHALGRDLLTKPPAASTP